MFRNFINIFYDFWIWSEHKLEEKKEEIKYIEPVEDVKMEEEKKEEINTNSKKEWPKEEPKKEENKKHLMKVYIIQKFYYRIYKNIDGEPHEESYTT